MLKTDLTTYPTERASSSFTSSSPAWGCGLQDEFTDIHGEWGLPRKGASCLHSGLRSSSSRPVHCAQVAGEVLEEMCGQMGVTDSEEVQEFALFLIKGEGEYRDRDSLTCLGHCLRHRNAASVCVSVVSAGMGPLYR